MKEKVVIERLEEDSVAVYPYDDNIKNVVGAPMNVCHRIVANNDFNVVGEITESGLDLYDNDDFEEEDYSEFSQIEEDDEV